MARLRVEPGLSCLPCCLWPRVPAHHLRRLCLSNSSPTTIATPAPSPTPTTVLPDPTPTQEAAATGTSVPTTQAVLSTPMPTQADGFPPEILGMPVLGTNRALQIINSGALDGRVAAVAGYVNYPVWLDCSPVFLAAFLAQNCMPPELTEFTDIDHAGAGYHDSLRARSEWRTADSQSQHQHRRWLPSRRDWPHRRHSQLSMPGGVGRNVRW